MAECNGSETSSRDLPLDHMTSKSSDRSLKYVDVRTCLASYPLALNFPEGTE